MHVFIGRERDTTRHHVGTTAHLDGIGRDHAVFLLGEVAQGHHVLVETFFELEGAKIHPHTAGHGLVDDKLLGAGQAVDGVAGIGRAAGHGLVAHIDGIVTSLGHVDIPVGEREFLLVFGGRHLAIGTLGKRILEILILVTHIGKPSAVALGPRALAVLLAIGARGLAAVVVDNHGHLVRVALAGIPHIGACIFKHGHQEGYHIAVSVHVFNRLHQAAALPLPAIELVFKIQAVTGPHSHDVAIECLAVVAVFVDGCHKGCMLALVAAVEVNEVVIDINASDGELHLAALTLRPQGCLHVVLHLRD